MRSRPAGSWPARCQASSTAACVPKPAHAETQRRREEQAASRGNGRKSLAVPIAILVPWHRSTVGRVERSETQQNPALVPGMLGFAKPQPNLVLLAVIPAILKPESRLALLVDHREAGFRPALSWIRRSDEIVKNGCSRTGSHQLAIYIPHPQSCMSHLASNIQLRHQQTRTTPPTNFRIAPQNAPGVVRVRWMQSWGIAAMD
jgi:hypothetical protein